MKRSPLKRNPEKQREWEQRETDAAKMSDSNADGYPEDHAPLIQVAAALRSMADRIDPRYVCSRCGKTRGAHHRSGGLYRCDGMSATENVMHDWWEMAGAAGQGDA